MFEHASLFVAVVLVDVIGQVHNLSDRAVLQAPYLGATRGKVNADEPTFLARILWFKNPAEHLSAKPLDHVTVQRAESVVLDGNLTRLYVGELAKKIGPRLGSVNLRLSRFWGLKLDPARLDLPAELPLEIEVAPVRADVPVAQLEVDTAGDWRAALHARLTTLSAAVRVQQRCV
jgi:hypothetical protein